RSAAGLGNEPAPLPRRRLAGSGLRAGPPTVVEPVDVVQLPVVVGWTRLRHGPIVTAPPAQCERARRDGAADESNLPGPGSPDGQNATTPQPSRRGLGHVSSRPA